MTTRNLTVDASAVRLTFDKFIAHGVPAEILEGILGLTREQLNEPDKRVPFISNHLMNEKGVELTEPAIGLKIGTEIKPEDMGILGHIFRNCRNLKEAGCQLIRYFRLFSGMIEWKIKPCKTSVALTYTVKNPIFYTRFGVETAFSGAIT